MKKDEPGYYFATLITVLSSLSEDNADLVSKAFLEILSTDFPKV